MRPVVGIVGHGYVVARPFGDLPVVGSPTTYVDQVIAAGARPVLLPGAASVDLLDAVDALILTGGGDVAPHLYGSTSDLARDVDQVRDAHELALVRAAATAGVPLLGVCRGLQVLAVAFGGTLTADLAMRHVLPGVGHPVVTDPGSKLRALCGPRPSVTSLHNQAVADTGTCWRATAWTDDGVIEGIEWVGELDWPVLGVQWHPELEGSSGAALFAWLVSQPASSTRIPTPASTSAKDVVSGESPSRMRSGSRKSGTTSRLII